MKNVILRTALIAVIAVLILLFAAFGIASLGFPAQMAGLFENMGNYSFATGYASLAYKYDGSCKNLARCVEDSVIAGDDFDVVSFGKEFIEREDFAGFCNEHPSPSSYRHFIYGCIARSQYALGDKEDALSLANSAMDGGFPQNNALAALALAAVDADDKDFMQSVYASVNAVTPQTEEESAYRTQILIILSGKN